MADQNLISGLCERNQISEAEFYDWRETLLAGATQALARNGSNGEPLDVAQRERADLS